MMTPFQPQWDSHRHTLAWNPSLQLQPCNILYPLNEFHTVMPLGEPGHIFSFSGDSHGFMIHYNQKLILKLVGGEGIHWQKPYQFRGRFQFYTLSNHFYWKWKNLKIRLKCYYHLTHKTLYIRMDLKPAAPIASAAPLWLDLHSHPLVGYYPQRNFFPLTLISQDSIPAYPGLKHYRLELDPRLSRRQMVVAFPAVPVAPALLSLPVKRLNFKQEDQLWVQHTQCSRLLFDQQLICSGPIGIMQDYLSHLYLSSLYNTDYSKIPDLDFIRLQAASLSFARPDLLWDRRLYFYQYYPDRLLLTGEYLNQKIQRCLIISKGLNDLQVNLPDRSYRLVNATIDQTVCSYLKNETIDLSFQDRSVFFIDRV